MPDAQTFTVRANLGQRAIGLFVAVSGVAAFLVESRNPHSFRELLPPLLALPFGVLLGLDVSEIRVDPPAGVLTRRSGIWPLVKTASRAFGEVTGVVGDVVPHRRGRAKVARDHNRLRLLFRNGDEWQVFEEHHTGVRVRELRERLERALGIAEVPGRSG